MTFKQNVLDILTNRPEELPVLIDTTRDKKFLMRVLNSYMPYKTGIEIECNGSLSNIINKKAIQLTKELNCLQYHDDYAGIFRFAFSKQINEFCEHRICIENWRQAIALKRLCLLLQEHCTINPGGAIHFHINTPEILNWSDSLMGHHRMMKLQDKINSEFIEEFKELQGRYKYKELAGTTKEYMINLRHMGTIEFRMDKCSFDYNKISSQIVDIQRVMRRVRASMGWKVDFEQV